MILVAMSREICRFVDLRNVAGDLHRYCDEFSFRWNLRDLSDGERTVIAIMGSVGKRLMYRKPTEDRLLTEQNSV